MNEIITRWRNLEELEAENQLFEKYVQARQAYETGARRVVRGELHTDELKGLYRAERAAFQAYRAVADK